MRRWRAAILLSLVVQASSLGCTSGPKEKDDAAPEAAGGVELSSCDVVPTGTPTGTGTGSDTGGAAPVEPVEITMWQSENEQASQLITRFVDEFVAMHPGVVVNVQHLGSAGPDSVLNAWRATAPEQRPSLALMPEDATRRLADTGQVVAPGSCLAEVVPDLLPAIEADWSVNGVVQAVPFAMSTPVLIYDRQAFRDAGLDPDRPPSTLEELRTVSQQLVERGTVPTGLVFNTSATGAAGWLVEQWNVQAEARSVAPDDGRHGVADHAVWHEGPAVDHLAWLQEMVTDGLATSVGSNPKDLPDLVAVIGTKPTAAMTFYTSGSLDALSDTIDTTRPTGFELGVAPLPGPGSGSLPGGAGVWMAAGRSDAETRAAWSLAAYLASPSVQSTWAATTGYAPINRGAVEMQPLQSTWVQRPQLRVAYDALLEQGSSAGMSVGPEREIKQLWADALDAVVNGADPREALRDAATDADRLLRAYNRGIDRAPPR